MKYLWILAAIVLIFFNHFIKYDSEPSLIGEWRRERMYDTCEYDLKIDPDSSVYFRQTLFACPCIFTFDGRLGKDTIFHNVSKRCMNRQSKEIISRWDRVDTFLVISVDEMRLELFDQLEGRKRTYLKLFED